MKLSFRKHHLLVILKEFSKETLPLDIFLRKYFKTHRSIGSKDRKNICENLYKLIRWKGLIDFLCDEKPISFEKRIDKLTNFDFNRHLKDETIPIHIRVSFPNEYFEKVKSSYNLEKAIDFCLTSNQIAPTTIRSNPIKITRDDLFDILKEKYSVEKCQKSSLGIYFHKKINFFTSEEFKKGFFEIQDESSQLAALLINPKPKDHVLDYCAGSGGKSLAFAHKLKKTGQIYLHDIRDNILIEAKKRFKRAGIENFQIKTSKDLKKLNTKMDWLILDVPCSGSGTLRRNPDHKWKFKLNDLESLKNTQRKIFDDAIPFLKEDGKIVYITCSILPEENEDQINFFTKKYNLKTLKTFFTFPEKNLHDGFFCCVLKTTQGPI
ncbi:MAG: Ribosomal RNA small subunit methyltransferase B [Candidatus Anoxychlamydiales bacterium]|nr:Ribosomal RNA small subunit methyltransferase B [Candidatus Anoxychlamydiales bacterium]NGX36085.1 Ribosomal RNA small subunit methyltransferase B [Candidatus Anoxychlamydiales bacterium]